MAALTNDIYQAYVCSKCGYTVSLDSRPDNCPKCGPVEWKGKEGAQDEQLILSCSWCGNINLLDGRGYVGADEARTRIGHPLADDVISHGLCPSCYQKASVSF